MSVLSWRDCSSHVNYSVVNVSLDSAGFIQPSSALRVDAGSLLTLHPLSPSV